MTKRFYSPLLKNVFFLILLGFMLIPFLWISFFAVPSIDDYLSSGKAIRGGYFSYQLNNYLHWNGRYVSTALQSIPWLTNFWVYRFIPLVIFLLFVNSFYLLFKTVRPFDYYSKFERLLISVGILALYLTQIENTSNFYWFSGSVTYVLPLILLNYLLVCLYKLFIENNKKMSNVILASFLIFLIIGTGEVAMVFLDSLLLIFFLISSFKDGKFRFNQTLFFLGFIALISSTILFLAPGNSIRESATPFARNLIFAINAALDASLKYGKGWIFGESPLWLLSFPILFLAYRAFSKQPEQSLKKLNGYFVHPLLAFFLWFILMAATLFAPYYAVGNHAPDRTFAMIQFLFYLGFFYVLCTIAFYAWKHYSRRLNNAYPISCAFLILAVEVVCLFSDNLQRSYDDMISGKSSNFYQVNEKIKNVIANGGNEEIFVPGNIDVPKITSFEGNTNPYYMGLFFGKKVKIVKDLSPNDYLK